MTFTININGGAVVETFEATTLKEFIGKLSDRWKVGSKEGIESFFYDHFQVKTLIDTNLLVCRKR